VKSCCEVGKETSVPTEGQLFLSAQLLSVAQRGFRSKFVTLKEVIYSLNNKYGREIFRVREKKNCRRKRVRISELCTLCFLIILCCGSVCTGGYKDGVQISSS
jgi:hypothetical protein